MIAFTRDYYYDGRVSNSTEQKYAAWSRSFVDATKIIDPTEGERAFREVGGRATDDPDLLDQMDLVQAVQDTTRRSVHPALTVGRQRLYKPLYEFLVDCWQAQQSPDPQQINLGLDA